jgi:acyl-CoA synthetase (NDP forming)
MAADTVDRLNLELPSISDNVEKRLRQALPSYCVFDNPFDVTTTTVESFQLVMEENLKDENINAFLPIFADPLPRAAEAVKSVAKKTDKPIVVCYVGGGKVEDIEKEKMHEAGIPVFSTPEKAVTAFYALVRYNELQSKNI